MNIQKTINTDIIEENMGQIEGLPANPRVCKSDKFDRLVKSIEDNPEMLTLRPLMVFPHDGKYVAIGGNMRLKALKKIGYSEIPVVEIPPTATAEQLRAYAIKDNETFGEWDWDMLANEWDSEELASFGMDVWEQIEQEQTETTMSETEKLSDLAYKPLYYEPAERPSLSLRDCVNTEKFDAKIASLDEYDLTEEQRATLRMFAYRFLKIDFEAVANYYAFNATEAERDAIERLRLVLVDGGGKDGLQGYIEDDLIRVSEIARTAVMEG